MSTIPPRTLKGFRDLLPAQALRRADLVRRVEDAFRRHGYAPIDTPALEYEEILRGKGGEASDKELYAFEDRGGRAVALRFDLTVPLARYVAQHQGELVFPFRRYHVGPVWRGERPQKGRYREFLQCDADLVGAVGPSADAEIIVLMVDVYRALEVGGFTIRLNDRRVLTGLVEALGARELAVPVLRALDKLDKQGEEAVLAEMAAAGLEADRARRLLDVTAPRGDDAATLAALDEAVAASGTGRAGVGDLREVLRLVGAAVGPHAPLRVDPRIARGLDYYTGMVYEVALEDAPGFGSVGSGGRYDDLAGLYTKTRLPGVGGSVGLDRLLAALEEREGLAGPASPSEALVTHPGPERAAEALAFAAALRRLGHAVEAYPEPRKHAVQMRYADRQGIRFVFTPDADGSFQGKDLRTGDTLHVPDAEGAHAAMADRPG